MVLYIDTTPEEYEEEDDICVFFGNIKDKNMNNPDINGTLSCCLEEDEEEGGPGLLFCMNQEQLGNGAASTVIPFNKIDKCKKALLKIISFMEMYEPK